MAEKFNFKLFFWIILALCFFLRDPSTIFSIFSSRPETRLVINELVATNGTGLVDEDGDHSDWIEIHNRSDQAVNLSGWALTDDANRPQKWMFPDLTLRPGAYLVVFASGKNRHQKEPTPALHTNFRLDQDGEFLGLYDTLARSFIDQTNPRFPKQFQDKSYGRFGAAQAFGFLSEPTPGAANEVAQSWAGLVSPVVFSMERGFYDHPIQVELSTSTPESTIRYTTDNSEPTPDHGELYSGPIPVRTTTAIRAIALRPGFLPSAVTTHSYIFLDDVIKQPPNPPAFPEAWGKYPKDYYEFVEDTPVIADYAMDPEVANDPRYRGTLKDDLTSIPTLSIVTAIENFKIYGEPRLRGSGYERPVSVELIHADQRQSGFQENAGLRIQGGWGRWEFVPKHSFRLFFRREYGAPRLEHPLFPDSPVETFDTLVLRGGTDESYAGKPDPELDHSLDTYTRDEWLRASQIAMSGVGVHGIFVHLYLNGLYWGLYNVVERPDASFLAAHLGGEEEDWFTIKHGFTLLGPDEIREDGEIISGSSDRFDALQTLVYEGRLEQPDRYTALKSLLDTAHFADYIILNWYTGRESNWAENNWYAGMRNHPPGPLRYFMWDGEKTWRTGAEISFGRITDQPNFILDLFRALMKNPDFRLELADRLYLHLFNDGALTDANATARWLAINDGIDRAIVGESARWGDALQEEPITRQDWLHARDRVLEQMAGNAAKLIELARREGYYPSFDPPRFSVPAGLVAPGTTLALSAPEGEIYYTSDGSDPRAGARGAARLYQTPISITGTLQIKARLRVDDEWSALRQATFRVAPENENALRISEIMYNPAGSDDYEFIELTNSGERYLNLSGMSFEGISFIFPARTTPLAPGQSVVLVRNREAFASRYPNVPIGGIYEDQLSNEGETIRLHDRHGELVASVTYDDERGWPISPDGRGDSLVLIDPTADPDNSKSWRASPHLNGSPGHEESFQSY